jgi:hypothetical protein
MPGIEFDFDSDAANLQPAVRMLFQTYTDVIPYPHKFNDALVKAHLTALDFAVQHNLWKEKAEHEAYILGPILEMIKGWVEEEGPDKGLWGMYEANSCNYQLFEKINVSKKGERSFPCPYKEILEISEKLGTFKITWDDVHEKWCKAFWNACARKVGIQIEAIPGEICTVRLKK